jgi:crossover junction endodeoxyribonuclease RuvC
MRIIGIDPGYDRLGLAIVERLPGEKEKLIYSECFTTDSKQEIYNRLLNIGLKVRSIIEEYKPQALAIETLFITKNQKTAMRVSEARGIISYEALLAQIPVYEYTPLQIKMAITGDGKSDKTSIMKMLPLLIKINSKKDKIIDDEYDAIATALTHFAYSHRSFPQK